MAIFRITCTAYALCQYLVNYCFVVYLCSPSVLDRLNAMLEPGGVLTIDERGLEDSEVVSVKPHANFRFVTLYVHVCTCMLLIAWANYVLRTFTSGSLKYIYSGRESLLVILLWPAWGLYHDLYLCHLQADSVYGPKAW